MAAPSSFTTLFVAGYGNSGPDHWQRRWHEQMPGSLWVEQDDWEHPVCAAWIKGVQRTIRDVKGPVFFITHSLGGLTVIAWSRLHSHPVAGALLVAVPDPDAPGFPSSIHGYGSPALTPLRFPAFMVATTDDHYISVDRSRELARAWNCSWHNIGAHGHINAESGLGDWPEGRDLLTRVAPKT
jgi:predicted alpha/beta hydrolase family esterase